MFTINTSAIYRQFFGSLVVLGLTLSYSDYYAVNQSEAVEVVGKMEIPDSDVLSTKLTRHIEII